MLNQTELSSKFSKDTFAFQGAIGEKISTFIIGTLISGFVFAFISGWLMTLVLLASLPALAIAGGLYMKAIGNKDK
jgi:ATP-binding cassette subfamily B (MDR/TAP) protein 1